MATITRTYMIDDLDGSEEDVSTVVLSLDKKDYEIDLSAANEARLREKLARFVDAATPIKAQASAARRGRKAAPARAASAREHTAEIRAWAKEAGLTVSERGRIASAVQEAFDQAH